MGNGILNIKLYHKIELITLFYALCLTSIVIIQVLPAFSQICILTAKLGNAIIKTRR